MRIKEAVRIGQEALAEVFPEADDKALRFEAVEKSDDGKFWQVTFSFSRTSDPDELIARSYKTVKFRDKNGELVGARNGFLSDAA